jgi:hypothetical protein
LLQVFRKSLSWGLLITIPFSASSIFTSVYCFVVGQRIVILHAFIKKTQATPEQEVKIARKRMKEAAGKHAPSLTTLKRYAHAVGCHLEIKLVPDSCLTRKVSDSTGLCG